MRLLERDEETIVFNGVIYRVDTAGTITNERNVPINPSNLMIIEFENLLSRLCLYHIADQCRSRSGIKNLGSLICKFYSLDIKSIF